MYSLGEHYNKIFNICIEGLKEDKDNELLKNVMKVLSEYDNKCGVKYKITHGTIKIDE